MRKALSCGLYALRKVKNVVNTNVLRMLYSSIFESYLLYGIALWGNTFSYLLNPLVTLQKKAVRIVANKPYNSPAEPIFDSLKFLKYL